MNRVSSQPDPIRILLALLFLTTPLLVYPPGYDSLVLPKSTWIALVTCILVAALVIQPRRLPASLDQLRTPLDGPLIASVGAILLSNTASGYPAENRLRFFWLALVLFYILVYLFRRREDLFDQCLSALLVAGGIASVYVVLQDYGFDFLPWDRKNLPDWRFGLTGTMGNPNAVAGYLAALAPPLIFRFYRAPNSLRSLFWAFVLLLCSLALTVTFSVGAWIGLAFALLLTVWILRKNDYKPLSLALWAAIVGVAGALFCLSEFSRAGSIMAAPFKGVSPAVLGLAGIFALVGGVAGAILLLRKRFRLSWLRLVTPILILLAAWLFYMTPHPLNGRPGSILDQAAASDRWKTGGGARRFIWQTTALMVQEHPVFGIGFGRYFEEHGYYQGKHYLLRGTPHDRPTVGLVPQVHNEYYQQMAETGILGTFPMFWLVIVILTLWSRAYNRSSGTQRLQVLGSILGLSVLAIHALSSFPFRRPSTWLAGMCLLAHIVSVANPEGTGGKEDKKEGVSIPAFVRLVILVGLIFQMTAVVRPWIANVYVKKAVEGRLTPRGRLEYLNRAISWDPTMYAAHSVRALQLFSQGRFPEAIQAAQRAIHIREDLQMYKLISDSLLRMNRYEESARSWQGVLRLNPLYPPYLREAARRYRLAGDEETARHYERRAMQLETIS